MKKFYLFHQNNSGGYFIQNDSVDIYVMIQAESAEDANNKAEEIGIYFDGVKNGNDCECCGDRWYPINEWDARNEFKLLEDFKFYGDEEWRI